MPRAGTTGRRRTRGERAACALLCVLALHGLARSAWAQDPYDDPPRRGAPPGPHRPAQPVQPAQPPPSTAPGDDLRLQEVRPIEDPAAHGPEPSTDILQTDVVPLGRATAAPQAPAGAPPERTLPSTAPSASATDAAPQRVRIRYALEGIEVRGNVRTANRVVLRYVKFRAGDVLDVDDPEIELTKYRLLGTGFFASVQLSLRKGSRRGAAILVIEVVERNTFVVQNLSLGIAADEDTAGNAKPLSAYLGLQVAETNLAGTGITLGAGIGLAADQLSLRTRFADPAFAGTSWSADLSLIYVDARDFFGNRAVTFESPLLEQREVTDYAVVAYKRFGGTLGAGHDVSVASEFHLDYHLEQIDATVPTAASHVRGNSNDDGRDAGVREPIDFDILPGKSVLSTLKATFVYDSRDSPFLTKKGTRAAASIEIGVPPLGSAYGYQKAELTAQRWWQMPWKHVVSLEAYAGGIAGDAPFFEKFYVGDFTYLLPDRVLGLAPDRRQPPNFLDTDIIEVRYGDFAARLEGEYRIPLYTGHGSVYGVDVFATAGLYAVATKRELSDPPPGYSGLSRVPIDFTYNLGLRIDTNLGGVTLAFSNLLGLIPARGGERK